jgi:hypothetical protein
LLRRFGSRRSRSLLRLLLRRGSKLPPGGSEVFCLRRLLGFGIRGRAFAARAMPFGFLCLCAGICDLPSWRGRFGFVLSMASAVCLRASCGAAVRLAFRWHPRFAFVLHALALCVCLFAGVRVMPSRFKRRTCAFAFSRASALCLRASRVAPVRGGTYFSLPPQRKVGKRKRLTPLIFLLA